MTLLDEAVSVEELLRSVLDQRPGPAAVVVADGGSTDGTLDIIRRLARDDDRILLVTDAGGRSAGRNRAIEAAPTGRIACIDGGCLAEPGWLAAFELAFASGAPFLAGFYRAQGPTARSTAIGTVMVPVLAEVDPATFLPSARSVAFERAVWAAAGGFPEDLQFAEDTLFDERAIAAGFEPTFVPDALVRWTPPATFAVLARTLFQWGRGDGLAGLRGTVYRRLALLLGATGGLTLMLLVLRPALAALGLLPLLVQTARNLRHKWPTVPRAARTALIPAQLIHTIAVTLGFVVGWAQRRRGT